jgi:uncharacterized protein YkwD
MTLKNTIRPAVEQLEDRRVPASITLSAGGILTILGTAVNDQAAVSSSNGRIVAVLRGGASLSRAYQAAAVRQINFAGYTGNDSITNSTAVPSILYGGSGDDVLVGGSSRDLIFGQDGNDRIYGRGGNDYLNGGPGVDLLHGGDGNDTLISTPGDTLVRNPQPSTALNAYQSVIFQMTNGWRTNAGRAALRINGKLQLAAQNHAANMARLDTYGDGDVNGHILNGRDVVWRVAQVSYSWSWLGENVAYNFGYSDPARTMAMQWWNSAGHRENILRPDYTEIGIGFARGASGRWYGVQVFAQPG